MFGPYGYFKDEFTLISEYLRDHSIGIWQEKKGQPPRIGSGLCIEIADRLFIATCAHNFIDIPTGGEVKVFGANSSSKTPLIILESDYGEYGADYTLDAAWLEVDRDSAVNSRLLGVPLNTIDSYHSVRVRERYIFAGLPFEVGVKIGNSERDDYYINFGLFSTFGVETPANRIKNVPEDSIFLNYNEKLFIPQGQVKMPSPGGVSGGAIWYFPPDSTSEVWSPIKYPIVGLVSHHVSHKSLVAGMRMHHWLRYFLESHPEMSDLIEPMLKEELQ